jgi:hypothetical protein
MLSIRGEFPGHRHHGSPSLEAPSFIRLYGLLLRLVRESTSQPGPITEKKGGCHDK